MSSFGAMGEVAVAFPDDETTAEIIAGRLRTEGILARVDRGLHGSWQVASRGQVTVFVDELNGARAREILGVADPIERGSDAAIRIWIWVMIALLALGIGAVGLRLIGGGSP